VNAKFRLCCITKNRTNPAYDGARGGVERMAQKLGCTAVNLVPDTPDDPDEQRALLLDALSTSPDAILIAVAHPTSLNAALEKVRDSGIPLIFFVSESEGVRGRTFVTSDNKSLAAGIADYLIWDIGERGNLVVMEGSPNSPTTLPRTEGFLETAARFPDIEVVARCVGNYQKEDAAREMATVLQRHDRIDGVLAANDFMAVGVIEALERANRKAPVVGVNAVPDAITAIKAGRLRATAAYDAMKMACIATQAAVRVLSGLPVPDEIELPVDIVDRGNCDIWDLPYEERPLPDWEATVGVP